MGDQQHLDWLKEGVSSWNNRRQHTPFSPDLEDADISAAIGVHARADIRQITGDLRGIDLSSANLKNAILRDTDLTGSRFYSTDLTGANLIGSQFDDSTFVDGRLIGADLKSASLQRTRFWLSNLDNAILVGANATSAEFWECSLERAHLYSTNLRDTRFIRSDPWEANLFWNPNQDTVNTATLNIHTIKGINDLLTVVQDLRAVYSGDTTLYFRGESREFDELKPSVMRNPKQGMPPLKLFEAEMLTDLLTRQPDAFNGGDFATRDFLGPCLKPPNFVTDLVFPRWSFQQGYVAPPWVPQSRSVRRLGNVNQWSPTAGFSALSNGFQHSRPVSGGGGRAVALWRVYYFDY